MFDKSAVKEKEVEEGEEEVAEIKRHAKEKWNVIKNLFLKSKNPDEQKEDMCGIQVTSIPAAEGGYSIKMENTGTLQRIVSAARAGASKKAVASTSADFDFGDSDNLIIQDLHIPEIEVTGELTCTVTLSPGQVVALKLVPKEAGVDVAMAMSVAPGAKKDSKTLKSGAELITHTLTQCRGYDLYMSNPTGKTIMYDFDFSKSVNLSVLPPREANRLVQVSGLNATITLPPESDAVAFCILRTVNRDSAVRLHYNMSEPSAPTKETLKCGVVLVTIPLRHGAGFLLSLENPLGKAMQVDFDFGLSKNLNAERGAGVGGSGMSASARVPAGSTVDPFVTLTVMKEGDGMLMKYSVTHKEA